MRCHKLKFWTLLALLMLQASLAVGAEAHDVFSTLDRVPLSPAGNVLPWDEGVSSCEFSASSTPLALSDVVERALCNNPQTREAWANTRYQATQVGIGRSAYLPSVSATGSVSLNHAATKGYVDNYNQKNAGISLGYVLYDFGARDADLERAQQVLAAASASHDAALQAVFLDAVQAYYQFFAALAAVDSAVESEKSAQESLNAALARYNAGIATPADKLQSQTYYSQAVLNRVRAEGNSMNARGVLASSMGLAANTALELVPPSANVPPLHFEEEVSRLIEQARRHRPDITAAEAQIKAAQANVDAANASGKPTVSLSTSLGFADSSISNSSLNAALGVQISIPIFTGYNTTYRIRAAQEQVEVRQIQREKLGLQIALDVWQAYQNLTTETQAYRSSLDLVTSAAQSEKVALGRYKAGVGNIIDVLVAQSALASARQQQIQTFYNWHIAKAGLAQAMGQLDMAAIAAPTTTIGNQP